MQPMADPTKVLTRSKRRGRKRHGVRLRPRRGQAPQPSPEPAELLAFPDERKGHGDVERIEKPILDAEGLIGHPFRAIDVVAGLLRRGMITAEMHDAGQEFRKQFAVAHLDPLKACDLVSDRVQGTSRAAVQNGVERAKRYVAKCLDLVGGFRSDAASCLWHVLGFEMPLAKWATDRWLTPRITVAAAEGVLIAALGVLAR